MTTQRKLQLVSGVGHARDGATQLEETLKRLQRQLTIRPDEGFKNGMSLKAKYGDHFDYGAKMRSVSLVGPVWKLSCRFEESSYTILSLQVDVFFLYRGKNSNFIVKYHIDDRGYTVHFVPTTENDFPDGTFERKDGWLIPDPLGDPGHTYNDKPAKVFSPQWLFVKSCEDSSLNLFPPIAKFFERITRNVEHHGRYNFFCKPGGSKQKVQTISLEELDDALDNQ